MWLIILGKATLKKLGAMIFLIISLFCFLAYFQETGLPSIVEIDPRVTQEPLQTPTNKIEFEARAYGYSYRIKPLYQYKLSGVIVSMRDHTGYKGRRSHRSGNNINVADICVIWGNNAKNNAYTKMSYRSGDFTCFFKTTNMDTWRQFNPRDLSNNHLLTNNPAVAEAINNAEIGDQITFNGYLVAYGPLNGPYGRISSTTRDDTGNGACESVYVEDFEIIAKRSKLWLLLLLSGILSLIISFILWWRSPATLKF